MLTLPVSKTKQAGPAEVVGVARGNDPATCPMRALLARRDAQAEELAADEPDALTGPLFRPVTQHGRLGVQTGGDKHDALSSGAVAAIVKAQPAASIPLRSPRTPCAPAARPPRLSAAPANCADAGPVE